MGLLDALSEFKSNLVTVVLTSCGRPDCLRTTIESFEKYNTFPIAEFIIVEDSGSKSMHKMIRQLWPNYTLIFNEKNLGQVESIDKAYSRTKTQMIFHTENDWEYTAPGFIEKSIEILLTYPEVMQVWIRGYNDTNGHPVLNKDYKTGDVIFRLLATGVGGWGGFTWNPGLRRKSDYEKIGPFSNIRPDLGKKSGYREMYIGQEFYKHGFRAAILPDSYCKHIGYVSKDYSLT